VNQSQKKSKREKEKNNSKLQSHSKKSGPPSSRPVRIASIRVVDWLNFPMRARFARGWGGVEVAFFF